MRYYITKNWRIYLKLFKASILISNKMTFWQTILISIKPKSLFNQNMIGQALEKILKHIS